MDILESIDDYFSGKLSPELKAAFEKRVTDDASFAKEVAFYLSAQQVLKERLTQEKKEHFKTLYQQNAIPPKGKLKSLQWKAMLSVAASILVIAGLWFFFAQRESPKTIAQKYIHDHLETLSIQMSAAQDSLQHGIHLYNDGKYDESLQIFETLSAQHNDDAEAKKYAGIVSLQVKQYDKALKYFTALEQQHLYANPGKFYHALCLMMRNAPGDKPAAKHLLQEVIDEDLEGKEFAVQWLSRL